MFRRAAPNLLLSFPWIIVLCKNIAAFLMYPEVYDTPRVLVIMEKALDILQSFSCIVCPKMPFSCDLTPSSR